MSYRDEYVIKNPNNIGGRSTDIAIIGHSIYAELRDSFPINQVPTKYVVALEKLQKLLDVADSELASVIETFRVMDADAFDAQLRRDGL